MIHKWQRGVEIQRLNWEARVRTLGLVIPTDYSPVLASVSKAVCSQLLHIEDPRKPSPCMWKVKRGGYQEDWMSLSMELMWSLEEQGWSRGPLSPATAEEPIDAANTPDWLPVTAPISQQWTASSAIWKLITGRRSWFACFYKKA